MIDFILLCQELHIPFIQSGHHHCVDGWAQTHCPFCGGGNEGWHLGFNLEFGNMNCWRCGKHNVFEWLQTIQPKAPTKQILKKYSIKQHTTEKKVFVPRTRETKPPSRSGKMVKAHHEYLQSRKFDSYLLESVWGLLGTKNLSKEWNWRILASLYSLEGNIVGWTGRTISEEVKQRWKTTSKKDLSEDPRKLFYGLQKAEIGKSILIVEGPSDVWRLGAGAVATLGIDWTEEQAGILRLFKRRFIMFDNQDIAQKKAEELANWLSPLPGETILITDLKTDPGDLPQKEANSIMKELGLKGYK